jgi:hypothetical protein
MGEWIQLDMPEMTTIDGVTLKPNQYGEWYLELSPKDLLIVACINGAWTAVSEHNNLSTWTKTGRTLQFATTTTAKQYRIIVRSIYNGTTHGVSLSDIKFTGLQRDEIYRVPGDFAFVNIDLASEKDLVNASFYFKAPNEYHRMPRDYRVYKSASSAGPWSLVTSYNISTPTPSTPQEIVVSLLKTRTRYLRLEFLNPHDSSIDVAATGYAFVQINECIVWATDHAALNAFDTNGSTEARLSQTGPADTKFITADAGTNITVAGFDTYVQNPSYPLTIRLLTGATPSGPWSLHAEQVLASYPAEKQLLRFDFIQTTFRYFKLEFTRADFDFVRMNTFQFYNREYISSHNTRVV